MDRKSLLVKNLPGDVPLWHFFQNYGAISAKSYGRNRAIARFQDEHAAYNALHRLHQMQVGSRLLSVEYLGASKLEKPESEKSSNNSTKDEVKISDFVRSLYATSSHNDFEQPPPPYLKYAYPKINRTILDSISISLLTNQKFYTQVLHLMNRMNLEPPFLPRSEPFVPPGDPCDAQTQTDFVIVSEAKTLLASDESELESDQEIMVPMNVRRTKRKALDDQQIKAKARKVLQATRNVNPVICVPKSVSLEQVFETENRLKDGKIALNVSTVVLPEMKNEEEDKELHKELHKEKKEEKTHKPTVLLDLKSNRIPIDQLKELPIYKNYKKGEPSNKLYLKNLSKEVTEEDLRAVYGRFTGDEADPDALQIRLMQHGKMKGQAFVTFTRFGNEELHKVEEALDETNGFILKNKPIIASFGRK